MATAREGKRDDALADGGDGLEAWAEASGRRRTGDRCGWLQFVFCGRVST